MKKKHFENESTTLHYWKNIPEDCPLLETLFNYSHIEYKNLTVFQTILLITYLPFGLILLILRFILFLLIGMILILIPNQFFFPNLIIKHIMIIFGIAVRIKRTHNEPISSTVIVGNHRGSFDVFPFLAETNVNVLVDKSFFETNYVAKQFQKVCGAIPIDRESSKISEAKQVEFRKSIINKMNQSNNPLLVFPEGWDTNGKKGLLLFQKFLFSVGRSIQPVAIRCSIPLLPMIEPNVLGTTITQELMYLFFVPYFLWELTFLPLQNRYEDETPVEFAARVQKMIANELGIYPTKYSFKDALVLRKKKISNFQKSYFYKNL